MKHVHVAVGTILAGTGLSGGGTSGMVAALAAGSADGSDGENAAETTYHSSVEVMTT